jgi:hypothetical protein
MAAGHGRRDLTHTFALVRAMIVLVLVSCSGGPVAASGDAASRRDAGPPRSYATNFDGAENPLSESGAWSHVGLDWALAVKAGGIAFGTQTGTGGYDDSYALLSGFGPDQGGSGVVQISPNLDGHCSHEVEILLRFSDSAHSARGYECNLAFDGSYAQIVRWNGALGNFTILGGGSVPGGVASGATFSATISGSVITSYLNGVKVAQVTDASYPTGNPGVGFFRTNCGTGADFGFTSYSASEVTAGAR